MKICSKCKEEKELRYFCKSKPSKCKSCISERNKKYRESNKEQISKQRKEYRKNNKEKISNSDKQYRENNKEKVKLKDKEYRDNNRESLNEKQREYYTNNKEPIAEYKRGYQKINKVKLAKKSKKYRNENLKELSAMNNEYQKKRRKEDPCFRLRTIISSYIYRALKAQGASKSCSSFQMLSYTKEDLHEHIESLFEPWMTWDNWARYDSKTWKDKDQTTWTWSLDHIIPQSDLLYDSKDHPNFIKCWQLSNLRPYSAKQNLLDGANKVRHKN